MILPRPWFLPWARHGLSVEEFLAATRVELGATAALAQELDALVRPALVMNKLTKVVHRTVRAERLDPDRCTTLCGWAWAKSLRSKSVVAAEVEAAGSLLEQMLLLFLTEPRAVGWRGGWKRGHPFAKLFGALGSEGPLRRLRKMRHHRPHIVQHNSQCTSFNVALYSTTCNTLAGTPVTKAPGIEVQREAYGDPTR